MPAGSPPCGAVACLPASRSKLNRSASRPVVWGRLLRGTPPSLPVSANALRSATMTERRSGSSRSRGRVRDAAADDRRLPGLLRGRGHRRGAQPRLLPPLPRPQRGRDADRRLARRGLVGYACLYWHFSSTRGGRDGADERPLRRRGGARRGRRPGADRGRAPRSPASAARRSSSGRPPPTTRPPSASTTRPAPSARPGSSTSCRSDGVASVRGTGRDDPRCWSSTPTSSARPTAARAGSTSRRRSPPGRRRTWTPPDGVLLLARVDGDPAGIGGVRHLDTEIAEVKSMYVVPGLPRRRPRPRGCSPSSSDRPRARLPRDPPRHLRLPDRGGRPLPRGRLQGGRRLQRQPQSRPLVRTSASTRTDPDSPSTINRAGCGGVSTERAAVLEARPGPGLERRPPRGKHGGAGAAASRSSTSSSESRAWKYLVALFEPCRPRADRRYGPAWSQPA